MVHTNKNYSYGYPNMYNDYITALLRDIIYV